MPFSVKGYQLDKNLFKSFNLFEQVRQRLFSKKQVRERLEKFEFKFRI